MAREYRTTLQFPARVGEQIVVRDGRGRKVETWTVMSRQDGKNHSFIAFDQVGYKNAGML